MSVTEGIGPGATLPEVARRVHANLPQLLEQGVAQLEPFRVQAMVDNLSDFEWQRLALNYTKAVADANRKSNLVDLLSHRVDRRRVGRVAHAFSSQKEIAGAPDWVNYLHYTVEEIYLSFRTAPVGALTPVAAAFGTALTVATGIKLAWDTGQVLGAGLAWVLETYTPSVWHWIGGNVATVVNPILAAHDLLTTGLAQESVADALGMSDPARTNTQMSGGDFNIAEEWWQIGPFAPPWPGGGGGGCGGDKQGGYTCPILQ